MLTALAVMKDLWLPVSNSTLTLLSLLPVTTGKAVCKTTFPSDDAVFPTQVDAAGSSTGAEGLGCGSLGKRVGQIAQW